MSRPIRRLPALLVTVLLLALAAPLLAAERWVEAPDGRRIAVTTRGGGAATLLFVHCWSCDRGTWGDLPSRLADGYQVVALDLPGHGASDGGRDSWSIADYGADVAAVIDALGTGRVVLVGHSMGGPVSLEAARLRPDAVIGIVAVDTLQDVDFAFPQEQWDAMLAGFEADFAGTCGGFITQMFPATADTALVAHTRDTLCDADPAVALALLRDIFRYDVAAALAAAGVPVRGINATAFPTDFATNRRHADFDAVVMEGVGHFPHLEKPAEFEQHLRRWAAELAPPPEERVPEP